MYEGDDRFVQGRIMRDILDVAPSGDAATDYDRRQLALYAALLDADDMGLDWRKAVVSLMQLDPLRPGAELCWHSHLERARWIVGPGLAQAVEVFGQADA